MNLQFLNVMKANIVTFENDIQTRQCKNVIIECLFRLLLFRLEPTYKRQGMMTMKTETNYLQVQAYISIILINAHLQIEQKSN